MYRNTIESWLEESGRCGDMRSAFVKTFGGGPAEFIRIPGTQDIRTKKAELMNRWNSLLLETFSRSEIYRREDVLLRRELGEFLTELTAWEKKQECGICYELEARMAGFGESLCIGREAEMEKIKALFQEHNLVFLRGQRGIGKSTLAKAYAWNSRDQYHTIVFASCENGLKQLLANDSQLNISGLSYEPRGRRGELGWYCRKKLQILEQITDEGTLLILDNLDRKNDEYLERFCRLPCRLLVTTICRQSREEHNVLEVGPLKQEEQLRLLESAYGETLSGEVRLRAARLLLQLGGNTLRIRQLGLFGRERKGTREVLPEEFLEEMEPIFRLESLSDSEQNVLRNAALLPLKGVDEGFFLSCGGKMTVQQISALVSLGFLEREASGLLRMPPMVKDETVKLLKPGWYSCRAYIRRFTDKLADFWNFTGEQKSETADYILSLLWQLSSFDVRCLKETFALADLLWQLGQWEFAAKYTKKLYEFCEKELGDAHPDTARAAHLVGSVYHNQNLPQQAAAWYQKAWFIYQKSGEKDSAAEACYRMKYSRSLLLYGEYGQMEKMYARIEQIYRQSLRLEKEPGRRRALEAGQMNYYVERARTYLKLERYEDALEICRRAECYHREIHDGGATRAYIYHDMGRSLAGLGRWREAVHYLKLAGECAAQYFHEGYGERREIAEDLEKVRRERKKQEEAPEGREEASKAQGRTPEILPGGEQI